MTRGFYNYDTRGASPATQIINLERMVSERDEEIAVLRAALDQISKHSTNWCAEYARQALFLA